MTPASNAQPLLFRQSPFSPTAAPAAAGCWAGHPEALQKLRRIQRSYTNRSDSSLDLIWANFGAGKTHALYHLRHLLGESPGREQCVCVYTELPEQVRSFLDVYRRIVVDLPVEPVFRRVAAMPAESFDGDLWRAAHVILHGGGLERDLALRWFRGDRPGLNELKRSTGISGRIETDLRAQDILCGIVAALAPAGVRLVVLLDEYQRIGVLKPQGRTTVLSNLRSVFSRNASGFSAVLAVTSRLEKTAMELIPNELKTILGPRPSISLPEMSPAEAYEFVLERFRFFRPADYAGDPAAPFSENALRAVLNELPARSNDPLTPRLILQTLGLIEDEAARGPRNKIGRDAALEVLKAL